MALNLLYPLKKGSYHRVRGYMDHVKAGAGPWYGIDDGCVVGTQLYAVADGKVSFARKQNVGGGWNFRLNIKGHPGFFYWYAHCSKIPSDGKVFKKGDKIGKSGATGGVTGPHLHHSLLYKGQPKNNDNNNVVQYTEPGEKDMYKESPAKYSDGKERSAKEWFNAFVTELKRKKNKQEKIEALNKIVSQQSSQLKTLAGQVEELQLDNKDLTKEVEAQRVAMAEMEGKVVELNEKLKLCMSNQPQPSEPTFSLDILKQFFKDLFNGRV